MTATPAAGISTRGSEFVDGRGRSLRLRGVGVGGWLNMENFITGFSANESLTRKAVRGVIGGDRADRFFDRLLSRFFAEADAAFLGESGFNVARIPVNYCHSMLLNLTVAQPLAYEYAELFRGLDDSDLDGLADSFAFNCCQVRTPLLEELRRSFEWGLAGASAGRRAAPCSPGLPARWPARWRWL